MGQDTEIIMSDELFLISGVFVLVIDLLFLAFVYQRTSRQEYYGLNRAIIVSSFVFWSTLWTIMLVWGWGWFYQFIFPDWVKQWAPFLGVGYAFIGFVIWWIPTKLPGNPYVTFCLLGGLEGILSHLWALFGLQSTNKIPALTGIRPFVIIFFALAEKILYWSMVVSLAVMIQRTWIYLKRFLHKIFVAVISK